MNQLQQIRKIHIEELMKMEITIPTEQRIQLKDKINDIVEYQINIHKQRNTFLFSPPIHIEKLNNELYLIDGQHRYEAIKQLYHKKYTNFYIYVEEVTVNNMEEMKENYKMINYNTPLPEFPEKIDKQIPEQAFRYFEKKYPSIWGKASARKPRRPHINQNSFQEALGYLTDKLNIQKYNDLIEYIENENSRRSVWNIEAFPRIKTLKDPQKTLDICKQKGGFYLGMWFGVNQEWIYDWCKDIVKSQTGIEPMKKKIPRKKKIPKKIRDDCWKKYGKGKCWICSSILDFSNFEAGHIKAKSKGGSDTIDNLRPICSQCNKSQGSKNMKDYINEYYPKNKRLRKKKPFFKNLKIF